MQALISVVIPIYNVEIYIKKCIDSIIDQTYTNLEIILIDDGATDNCPSICDEYAKIDNRIIVIHKKNGGLSDARNAGIDVAKGKYISFIDSDDWVACDYIEYLYNLLIEYSCAMSICSHTVVLENGKQIESNDNSKEVLESKTCIEKMLYHDKIDTSAWAKLYSKDLFKNIRFPVGKLFEDIGTTYKLFLNSSKIAVGYESKYYYFIRSTSIVNNFFNIKKLDLLEMTDSMSNNVLKVYPSLQDATICRQVYSRISTLNQMVNESNYLDEKQNIIKFILNYKKNILKNPKVKFKEKMAVILLSINFSLYKFLWNKTKNYLKKI